MTDYYKKVTDREGEFSQLFSRMDKDRDLCTLKEFSLQDKDDRDEPDVDNITLNDSRLLFNRVCEAINKANMQTVVEGKGLKDKETSLIEGFCTDLTAAVDVRLHEADLPGLNPYNIQQMVGRGRVATRVCLRMDGKKFVADLLPTDTRYFIYANSMDGLEWAAPRYYRSHDDIKTEYGIDLPAKTSALLTDFWDDEAERVHIERDLVKELPHPYGEVPFVIQVSPTGLYSQDEDRMKHMGESIFAASRELYEQKNKAGSILMTLTVMSFYRGLQYESEKGAGAKKPLIPPYGKRIIVPVDKGMGYKAMPIEDVNNAARWIMDMLEKGIQKAGLPDTSYGSLTFPLSAVAIASLSEAEDQIYLPLLQGLSLYYQRLYRMCIRQFIAQKMSVALGDEGWETEYNWRELDKKFTIKFKFFSTSPKQQIANYSVANTAANWYGRESILADILHDQNPTESLNKWRASRAEDADPAIGLYNLGHALIDQERDLEAELILQQLETILRQRNMPQIPGAPTPLPAPPKQLPSPAKELIPLLSDKGGRAKVSTEKVNK